MPNKIKMESKLISCFPNEPTSIWHKPFRSLRQTNKYTSFSYMSTRRAKSEICSGLKCMKLKNESSTADQ